MHRKLFSATKIRCDDTESPRDCLTSSLACLSVALMDSDNPGKHFIAAFVLALVCYSALYYGIEYRRARKGPWDVAFGHNSKGEPILVINQPVLAISNVTLAFAGETALATNLDDKPFFGRPRPVPYAVPFGQCIFMDTTFLPGTLTFRLLGHEIELLPRVLMIDHDEYPWLSGTNIVLPRAQGPLQPPRQ